MTFPSSCIVPSPKRRMGSTSAQRCAHATLVSFTSELRATEVTGIIVDWSRERVLVSYPGTVGGTIIFP